MIIKITEAFTRFIAAIKRNGILISLYAVALLIILYSFIVNPINPNDVVNKLYEQKEKEHIESVDKRMQADTYVPQILKKIRLEYNLYRVCLLELHNNTENLNWVSFLYFSMMYEDFDFKNDSITEITDSFQKQRITQYADLFDDIKKNNYAYYHNLKDYNNEHSYRLIKKIANTGANSILYLPLRDNGQIKGLLTLSSDKDSIDIAEIGSKISTEIEAIQTLIF